MLELESMVNYISKPVHPYKIFQKSKIETHVKHQYLGIAYPEVGDPPFSMVYVQYSCWGPYLFDQSSQKEKISPGITTITIQTSKI